MSHRFTAVRRLACALAALVAFGVATGAAGDHHQISAADDASKPFVVKIHADWCGTCRRLEATLEALRERTGDDVRIVVQAEELITRSENEEIGQILPSLPDGSE